MAWGELRYDHSDIFNERPRVKVGRRKDSITPGSLKWEAVLDVCSRPEGADINDVGRALGHKSVKGATSRILNMMVDAGALSRRKEERRGVKGPKPYIYRKVQK